MGDTFSHKGCMMSRNSAELLPAFSQQQIWDKQLQTKAIQHEKKIAKLEVEYKQCVQDIDSRWNETLLLEKQIVQGIIKRNAALLALQTKEALSLTTLSAMQSKVLHQCEYIDVLNAAIKQLRVIAFRIADGTSTGDRNRGVTPLGLEALTKEEGFYQRRLKNYLPHSRRPPRGQQNR